MATDWPRRLVAWYRANARDLPWRRDGTPYRVWISEVMLQQTRVETVRDYYRRFLARFPDVQALAAADLAEVLKLWEGLGYYSRARNLHKAAQAVAQAHGGELPGRFAELRKLPGFGPYTAAAVASIGFGEAVPVVDGNVLRVYCRFTADPADIGRPATRRAVFAALQPAIAGVDPAAFNQGLMELGALVCKPRQPRCEACPLAADCVARREGRTAELPVKAAKAPVPHHDVAVALLWRGERLLVQRRPVERMLGGLWELPGGKVRAGESLAEALRRRLLAETGLEVTPGPVLGSVRHAFTHFRITVHAHAATASGEPQALDATELRWVNAAEAEALAFPKATRRILEPLWPTESRLL